MENVYSQAFVQFFNTFDQKLSNYVNFRWGICQLVYSLIYITC